MHGMRRKEKRRVGVTHDMGRNEQREEMSCLACKGRSRGEKM